MTDAIEGPYTVWFHCHAVTGDFRAFADFVLGQLPALDLPAIAEWSDYGERHKGTGKDLANAVALQPSKPEDAGDDPVLIGFDCKGGSMLGTLSFEPAWREASLATVRLQWVIPDAKPGADVVRFQQRCADLCARIMERFQAYAADLCPEDGGAICFPEVPLVTANSHIVITNAQEADDLYDDPAAFWDAGWRRVVERDGQVLLTRALDRVAGPDYLERIIDGQWAMARAAKSGEATYEDPVYRDDEQAIFAAGAPRLQFVGYDADEKLAEYSCAAGEGEHIPGWEIYAMREIVAAKALPDGHAVTTVRVVFVEEAAARVEKRPLLDVGCRVFHYDANGKLRELAD